CFPERRVTDDASRRCHVLLTRARKTEEAQQPTLARRLADRHLERLRNRRTNADLLERIFGAGLAVGAGGEELQIGVEDEEIVVVRCRTEWVVPLQDAGEGAQCPHAHVVGLVYLAGFAEEVVKTQ